MRKELVTVGTGWQVLLVRIANLTGKTRRSCPTATRDKVQWTQQGDGWRTLVDTFTHTAWPLCHSASEN
jgi:hypothetical protein